MFRKGQTGIQKIKLFKSSELGNKQGHIQNLPHGIAFDAAEKDTHLAVHPHQVVTRQQHPKPNIRPTSHFQKRTAATGATACFTIVLVAFQPFSGAALIYVRQSKSRGKKEMCRHPPCDKSARDGHQPGTSSARHTSHQPPPGCTAATGATACFAGVLVASRRSRGAALIYVRQSKSRGQKECAGTHLAINPHEVVTSQEHPQPDICPTGRPQDAQPQQAQPAHTPNHSCSHPLQPSQPSAQHLCTKHTFASGHFGIKSILASKSLCL